MNGMQNFDLKNLLLNLPAMKKEPQHMMSHEELDKLADDMILRKNKAKIKKFKKNGKIKTALRINKNPFFSKKDLKKNHV